MKNLGNKLKLAREEAHLSQLQTGKELNVSDKTISGYESERIMPPLDNLLQLADLYKKPLGFFVGTDVKDYKMSSRLRAVELMLREVHRELRELKTLVSEQEINN
jgi:transcriptional regulator with XRE-family HTH domain